MDRLIDGLWGKHACRAAKLVQGYVSQLRKVIDRGQTAGSRPGRGAKGPPSDPAARVCPSARGGATRRRRFPALLDEGRTALGEGDADAGARSSVRRLAFGGARRWPTSPTSVRSGRDRAARGAASDRDRGAGGRRSGSRSSARARRRIGSADRTSSAARAPARAADARALPLRPPVRGPAGLPGGAPAAGRGARARAEPRLRDSSRRFSGRTPRSTVLRPADRHGGPTRSPSGRPAASSSGANASSTRCCVRSATRWRDTAGSSSSAESRASARVALPRSWRARQPKRGQRCSGGAAGKRAAHPRTGPGCRRSAPTSGSPTRSSSARSGGRRGGDRGCRRRGARALP